MTDVIDRAEREDSLRGEMPRTEKDSFSLLVAPRPSPFPTALTALRRHQPPSFFFSFRNLSMGESQSTFLSFLPNHPPQCLTASFKEGGRNRREVEFVKQVLYVRR